ncbi:MAG: chromophore lyase CpcT/CpeT, partial [Planctomycetota bacterium]
MAGLIQRIVSLIVVACCFAATATAGERELDRFCRWFEGEFRSVSDDPAESEVHHWVRKASFEDTDGVFFVVCRDDNVQEVDPIGCRLWSLSANGGSEGEALIDAKVIDLPESVSLQMVEQCQERMIIDLPIGLLPAEEDSNATDLVFRMKGSGFESEISSAHAHVLADAGEDFKLRWTIRSQGWRVEKGWGTNEVDPMVTSETTTFEQCRRYAIRSMAPGTLEGTMPEERGEVLLTTLNRPGRYELSIDEQDYVLEIHKPGEGENQPRILEIKITDTDSEQSIMTVVDQEFDRAHVELRDRIFVIERIKTRIEHLTELMIGSFDSVAQSERDESYFPITLEMVPIWTEMNGAKWLYIEQAVASAKERPYRQRVYRVTESAEGIFESAVFELPNAMNYAGEWQEEDAIADLSPLDLSERKGCSVFLKMLLTGEFEGSTDGKNCLSSLNGASYATSEVAIGAHGLTSWDRGFDDKDEQIWGAVDGAYVFD